MESLAGDGFIGALLPVPVSAEPEWVRADGSMKDTEEVGCWPTPSKVYGKEDHGRSRQRLTTMNNN